jgi:hypothetical protein
MVTRRKRTTRTKKRTVRKTKRAKTTRRRSTSGKKSANLIRISFKGQRISVEKMFGKTAMTPEAVARKLWSYVNRKKLAYYK